MTSRIPELDALLSSGCSLQVTKQCALFLSLERRLTLMQQFDSPFSLFLSVPFLCSLVFLI
ncbi:hypothetical protein RchiOBHm_Chr5g0009731 [Rosa chinensis]|uniref:Uncharacterized protein n=1 Tax=Rosa chinensis TaxID=74649 RepID=A0A2P6Q4I3_ROSCH|nr:hypothetical protein RchiOBHm_Chr5g0009731 [Rosa chinensis]